MAKTKNSGFTLIEILIAVVIIGLLAAVVGVALNIIKKNSADSRRISDIQQITRALELYYDKYAEYPGTLSSLVTEGFLPVAPTPPPGTSQIFYSYVPLGANQICTGYHLGAALETRDNEFLGKDADAYPSVPCAAATGPDFDGTALNCWAGVAGEGVKNDNCYDVKI
jgi:prepilin-type N-terminal cleavage/methylation domain-containing protein